MAEDRTSQRLGKLAGIGRRAAQAMEAGREEALREIRRLGLDVLRQGQHHGAAIGGIGQHAQRLGQARQQLLRPRDAIPIAGHRPEAVIGGEGGVGEILDLLQHRIGPPSGEDVARQQQQRAGG